MAIVHAHCNSVLWKRAPVGDSLAVFDFSLSLNVFFFFPLFLSCAFLFFLFSPEYSFNFLLRYETVNSLRGGSAVITRLCQAELRNIAWGGKRPLCGDAPTTHLPPKNLWRIGNESIANENVCSLYYCFYDGCSLGQGASSPRYTESGGARLCLSRSLSSRSCHFYPFLCDASICRLLLLVGFSLVTN